MRPGEDFMNATPTSPAEGDGLRALHESLGAHFAELRERRDQLAPDAPLFALEHSLSQAELQRLREQVRTAVRRGHLSRSSWLPFVVYAAELGYEYSGDEYWQTFAAKTPGWDEHGKREYIQRNFRSFKDLFGGAEPAGRWARQFTIICWPITHAVLPTDLQRQVARLLFECRSGLTSDLLADPDEFGTYLATQTWRAPDRFRTFAQNTSLLGRVASALLAGDDEPFPFLLDSTLKRIIGDIETERQAQHWLRGAKKAASSVRARGFQRPNQARGRQPDVPGATRAPSLADPELSLRTRGGKWTAFLALPDLSHLAERLPELGNELRNRRTHIAGVGGPPLPRSSLLYPGEQRPLSEWPRTDTALVRLEHGSDAANALLLDQCVLSSKPWLFKVRAPGIATEVRGKSVRPGGEYILLCEHPTAVQLPPWIAKVECGTAGVYSYEMTVLAVLDHGDLAILRALELSSMSEVVARPVGLVPALWDGDGRIEWLAGDTPLLGLAATRAVRTAIISVGKEQHELTWPTGRQEIFIQFTDLAVGVHDVDVKFMFEDDNQIDASGRLEMAVRPQQSRPTSGSSREGMMILATPVSPTLTEVWDGIADVQVRGPTATPVAVKVLLTDRFEKTLARWDGATRLPVGAREWADLLSMQIRNAITRFYDDAECCVISFSHPALGAVSLRCERGFTPLRWVAGEDRRGPFVRLINNSEQTLTLSLFPFGQPYRRLTPVLEEGAHVRAKSGGLVAASAGTASAGVILPPELPRDLRRWKDELAVVPKMANLTRSVDGAQRVLRLANAWQAASLTANIVGRDLRDRVLDAITVALAELIAGGTWARVEQRVASNAAIVSLSDLASAVGKERHQQSLAIELRERMEALAATQPYERVRLFTQALARYARLGPERGDQTAAEFLLRVASRPATVASWAPDDLQAQLKAMLDSPVLLRAARFVVLGVERLTPGGGGWMWE